MEVEKKKIEYLEIFKEIEGDKTDTYKWKEMMRKHLTRNDLTRRFSFAVPSKEAIEGIIKYNPIIEIGAGNGYWAYLINEYGGNIIAFDNNQRDKDWIEFKKHEYFTKKWFDVKFGEENKIVQYPNHTLFLCWVEHGSDYGFNCLKLYKGKFFIYIGMTKGGCTATDNFFIYLKKHFKKKESFYIPQWYGVHDWLDVYERR